MTVFNTYFKIIKRNFLTIFLTFLIFIGISMIFTKSDASMSTGSFDLKSLKIGLINHSSTEKSRGLEQYLKENFKVKTLKNNEKAIKDALFFTAVDYALVIDDDNYEDYRIPNSAGGVMINSYVNGYLNTYENLESAHLYTEVQLREKTLANLKEKVAVKRIAHKNTNSFEKPKQFYNLFAYGIMGSLISGVGIIGLALGRKDILKRTIISKTSISQRNVQLLLGHICFAILVWLVSNVVGVAISDIAVFSPQHFLFMLNSFVFILSIISLSFLLSNLIKDYNAISAVSNLIGIGLSFTSGVFVPQMYLSSFVLKVASFFPAYWYVTANGKIAANDGAGLEVLAQPSLVMLGMAAAFIAMGLVVAKQKKNY